MRRGILMNLSFIELLMYMIPMFAIGASAGYYAVRILL